MCEPCEQASHSKDIPQEFKDALSCCICQEIATLPVHSLCCERAKSVQPACLSCARRWYQQDRVPAKRTPRVKSFGGCGCDVFTGGMGGGQGSLHMNKLYEHSFQLDMVRNVVGPSVCFHEECGVSFDTCEELRRHLQGKARQSDKHGNCPEAIMKCRECSLFGKRSFIEGKHYREKHARFGCPYCGMEISIYHRDEHVEWHIRQHAAEVESIARLSEELKQRKKTVMEKSRKLDDLRNMFWFDRENEWNKLWPDSRDKRNDALRIAVQHAFY